MDFKEKTEKIIFNYLKIDGFSENHPWTDLRGERLAVNTFQLYKAPDLDCISLNIQDSPYLPNFFKFTIFNFESKWNKVID